MTGWKTWAAGIGMVLTGLGMIASAITSGEGTVTEGINVALMGLAALGIGHKVEKSGK